MIPDLEILSPCSVKEVVELLSKNNPDTKLIAGGTDIIPGFLIDSNRFRDINCLIDLAAVDEMKGISESDDEVTIGAACTFTEISRNKIECSLVRAYLVITNAAAGVIENPRRNSGPKVSGCTT